MLRLFILLRPRTGWLTLCLLLGTVVCLPLALQDSQWLIGAGGLWGVAVLAAWAGLMMAQGTVPGWLVALVGLLSGAELSVLGVGRVLPALPVIAREVVRSGRWLWDAWHWRATGGLPFSPLAPTVAARLEALAARLDAWLQVARTGGVSRDSLILLLLAGALLWWMCYYAGWRLVRGKQPLAAFVPVASALVTNVALAHGAGKWYLCLFLLGALALVAMRRFDRHLEGWQRTGIDYSQDLRLTTQAAAGVLAVLIMGVALLMPYVTWKQAVDTFWRYAYDPWHKLTQQLDRVFSGRNPLPAAPASTQRPGEGPHDLGGPVDLAADLVMVVAVSDPPPPPEDIHMVPGEPPEMPPQRYWRELTYDRYTGRGWENSSNQRVAQTAGEPLPGIEGPFEVLTQTYDLRLTGLGAAPVVNAPYLVSRPSSLLIPGEGTGVSGVFLADRTYTVTSRVPAPTIQQLKAAGTDYPDEIARLYLALPAIPERVRALAEQITAMGTTPYDKAQAIQEHLRGYDYDLKIPAPPAGQDVADYLLFQTKRGYCDYYATAMVVMLRAVGVPARYAMGYAMGSYDRKREAYAVKQRDAHAWVEVYFPGCGWVEFEPTPYRSSFDRPYGALAGGPTVTPAAPASGLTAWLEQPWWATAGVLLLAVLALGGVFWLGLRSVRQQRQSASYSAYLARRLYERMLRSAERAQLGPAPGDTPLEFSSRLGRTIEGRGEWAEGAEEEAQTVGAAYAHVRYAATPISAQTAGRALTAWEKLRGKMRWVWVGRKKSSAKRETRGADDGAGYGGDGDT